MIVTLSMLLVLINSINRQVHLNRSNLAQICNCDINSTKIYLNSTKIVSIKANTFQDLSNLQLLYLSNNQLSSIDAKTFQSLSNLLWLYLNNNQLSSIDTNTLSNKFN